MDVEERLHDEEDEDVGFRGETREGGQSDGWER